MIYLFILIYLIGLRISELIVAKSNEKYQKQNGAIEIKDPYYTYIVITHTLFFVFLVAESFLVHGWEREISLTLVIMFVLIQALRFWSLISLGRYWNTKVIVLPNAQIVQKGPYKWIKHPNYIVVGLEFLIIPLMFHAFVTATLFLGMHLWLMSKRIPMENQALQQFLTKQ
ncbi:hypothetical protein E3U55_04115 [Filobacillus milosensis]|uniref:Isoprenylcysteine carboxyl methyltransferase n=1 Tax=Filobacillus milosensis TaxID=94137 RepID=A0A4Y8IR23_9BACI|nr:isoprenylcysteine carboxylmethyltransferase family protein [Filobacillus milosensis]TFB24006.1 hypothetical protein E3U55_04115 [Filobacillus milosensis]